MSCLIRDNRYYDTEGNESVLYKDLESKLGSEVAHNLFVLSHTDNFVNKVVNPKIRAYQRSVKDKIDTLKPSINIVGYKLVKVNGYDTIKALGEDKELGYIRLKPFENGYQVAASNLSALTEKGKGVGTELYKKAIEYSFRNGKPLYSDIKQSELAQKVWNKLSGLGIVTQEAGLYKVENNPFKEIDSETIIEYARINNEVKEPLTNLEQLDVKKIMSGFSNITDSIELYNILKDAFYVDGLFNPSRKSLVNSGLYTSYEIENILSNINLQARIKTRIEKLKNTEKFNNNAYESLTQKVDSINDLGKLDLEKKEKEEVENTIDVISENGEVLQDEAFYDNAVRPITDPTIFDIVNTILNAHKLTDLTRIKEILRKKIADYGYDIGEMTREKLIALRDYIISPLETIKEFKESIKKSENRKVAIFNKDENKDLVYLETNKSEQELFDDLSLLKTGTKNVYHRITKVDFDEFKRVYKLGDAVTELNAYKQYFGYKKYDVESNNYTETGFEGDYNYLTKDFIVDFAAEKIKNKDNAFYNLFKITERGIDMIETDPISIDTAKAYIKDGIKYGKEIEQYSLISKRMPNLADLKTDLDSKESRRANAVNNPSSVSENKNKFTAINSEVLAVKNGTKEFIRQNKEVYELIDKKGNVTFYSKLEKNTDIDYYDVDVMSPEKNNYEDIIVQINDYVKLEKLYKKEDVEKEFECYN